MGSRLVGSTTILSMGVTTTNYHFDLTPSHHTHAIISYLDSHPKASLYMESCVHVYSLVFLVLTAVISATLQCCYQYIQLSDFM